MMEDSLFSGSDELKIKDYLKHLGYFIPEWIKSFFREPFKEPKKELDILYNASSILDSEPTDDNIAKCKELVFLHREIENTKARRRLEKWSLRVIATYLVTVLLVVVASYKEISLLGISLKLDVPDSVMITILSTTTVNIIGLGLIVLRGHFLANGKIDK